MTKKPPAATTVAGKKGHNAVVDQELVAPVTGRNHDAWIDESVAISAGTYVLAAAIAEVDDAVDIRAALSGLCPKGQERLHWRNEADPLRRKITATLAASRLSAIVVVATPVDPKRQERARRKCAERLFFELEQADVRQAWLEARTPSLNRRDLKLVDALRGTRAISPALRIDVGYPSGEPMLWAADAVAGAITAAYKHTADYRRTLQDLLTEIPIDL